MLFRFIFFWWSLRKSVFPSRSMMKKSFPLPGYWLSRSFIIWLIWARPIPMLVVFIRRTGIFFTDLVCFLVLVTKRLMLVNKIYWISLMAIFALFCSTFSLRLSMRVKDLSLPGLAFVVRPEKSASSLRLIGTDWRIASLQRFFTVPKMLFDMHSWDLLSTESAFRNPRKTAINLLLHICYKRSYRREVKIVVSRREVRWKLYDYQNI